MEKLNAWNAKVVSIVESGNQLSVVCEVEPSFFRDCDALVRSHNGRSEILAEKDTNDDDCDDWDDVAPSHYPPVGPVPLNAGALNDRWDVIEPGHYPPAPLTTPELDENKLSEVLRKQSISTGNRADKKQSIPTRNDGADKTSAEVEVVENGELESESQLSRQFRDIAAIIMQKTVNPETKRPYTFKYD